MEARISLGYKYFVGEGVHQNCDKAAAYYRPVAQSGFSSLPAPSGSPERNSAVAEEAMKGVMRLYGESPRLVNEEEASHEEEDVVQYWHYSAESGDAAAQVCNNRTQIKALYLIMHWLCLGHHGYSLSTRRIW